MVGSRFGNGRFTDAGLYFLSTSIRRRRHKVIYDLLLYKSFRHLKAPEEKPLFDKRTAR